MLAKVICAANYEKGKTAKHLEINTFLSKDPHQKVLTEEMETHVTSLASLSLGKISLSVFSA